MGYIIIYEVKWIDNKKKKNPSTQRVVTTHLFIFHGSERQNCSIPNGVRPPIIAYYYYFTNALVYLLLFTHTGFYDQADNKSQVP